MRKRTHRERRRKPWMHRRTPPGAAPGTLTVDPTAPRPAIRLMAYGAEGLVERGIDHPSDLGAFMEKWPVTWVNVEGLGDAEVIGKLGEVFGLHRLALEDVINVHQRAKVEQYGPHLFIVARMPRLDERLDTEQVSLFLGPNFVLTFQEGAPGDSFDPVRERVRKTIGRIRRSGPDYLAYSLIDSVVDSYYPVLERYGERVEALEIDVIARPDPRTVARIHEIKRDLLTLRRAIWPHRDAINSLYRDPTTLIADETRLHLRDCYDHAIQIIDLVETYRELASSLMEVYLSSVSNRMNEVMKVLTIIATIFIPLSFIAGVFGMNFNPGASPLNMPELNWYWGYPFAISLMAVTAGSLVAFFLKRGWIGGRSRAIHDDASDTKRGSTGV